MNLTRIHKRNIVVFIAFVCVFLLILNLITPFIYRALPNDYGRVRLIWNMFHDTSYTPEVVVFGNSRGMSGVNGYLLRDGMEGNPVLFSATSTGQRLSESILYYTSLPSSVKCVIQCVDIDQLADSMYIDTPNRVALHMAGYKMDDYTKRILPSLYEEMDYSCLLYNYEARNSLFMSVSSILRNCLDDDVVANVANTELCYPSSNLSDRNEVLYQHDLEEQNKEKKLASFQIRPEWKSLVSNAYQILKSNGIQYYWVLMPYNPDIKSMTDADKQYAKQCILKEFSYFPIIDCVDLLEASDFYDAVHPNRKGAEKLTERLSQEL